MNPKDFLIELVQRLSKENPKFFKVLSGVFFLLLCFAGGVGFAADLGITLPAWVAVVNAKVLGWISVFGLFFSRLPNADVNDQSK
ncbi:MAG: hypothetical protein J0L83_14675 [Chitinophagales bacterium]|nr:hypothetical protein [Chitinophagales bacterium]